MLTSARVREMMKKIRVEVDQKIESEWPGVIQIRATATMSDGTTREVHARDPKGTYRTPMSREDIKVKFQQLVKPVLGANTDNIFDQTWSIANSDDCKKVFDLLIPK